MGSAFMPAYEQTREVLDAADCDYLVFSVKDCRVAVPYYSIVQVVDSPSCTALPNMPRYVKGVIDFMGEATPLIDTRIILSMPSLREDVAELVKVFMTRKQDHLSWIAALKDSVNNDREITVEKDPHKCAFGQWYDTFKPNTLALASYVRRFDKPHRAIHNLAVQAEELIRSGQKKSAKKIIHEAENSELAYLVALFEGFEEQMKLSYQEYAVVITHNEHTFALSSDSIKYFEKMDSFVTDIPLMGNISEKLIKGIGRKKTGDAAEDVIILNLDGIFDEEGVQL